MGLEQNSAKTIDSYLIPYGIHTDAVKPTPPNQNQVKFAGLTNLNPAFDNLV